MPSMSLAAEASRNTFHFSTVLSALISARACCRLTSASDIGRRPKGVVTFPVSIVFSPVSRQKESAHQKRCQRLLTMILGNANLDVLETDQGFRDGDVLGLFSFAGYTSFLLRLVV